MTDETPGRLDPIRDPSPPDTVHPPVKDPPSPRGEPEPPRREPLLPPPMKDPGTTKDQDSGLTND
jgi:hypothetical protein